MSIIIASDTQLKKLFTNAIKTGLEISSGAKSTSTYYHTKDEQINATRKAIMNLYNVDKSIPILLACMDDATHFFRQEVLRHELKQGYLAGSQAIVDPSIWFDQQLQEKMIMHIISSLPFTYALRLFTSFKDLKINSTRARKKVLKWMLASINDFSAVKYRDKLRKGLKHALGTEQYSWLMTQLELYVKDSPYDAAEVDKALFKNYTGDNSYLAKLLLFINGTGDKRWYSGFKYTKAYFDATDAKTSDAFFEAAKLLDISVALGIINHGQTSTLLSLKDGNKIKMSTKKFLLENSKVISDDQKVRTKGLQERVGGKVREDVDYSKVQTESLYKTKGVETQKANRVEQDKIVLPYRNFGIIQDISLSNAGGADSANTPKVVIEHLTNVLKESGQPGGICMVTQTPTNQTDLTKPFIEILKILPDVEAIFVLSDGYENYPYEGCLSDFVAKSGLGIQIIHCSPYTSAEMGSKARSLGDNIISMAVTKPSQITTQMEARLLDFDPRKYFENSFSKYLTTTQKIQAIKIEEML